MTPARKRNLRRAPVVLLIRLPLLGALWPIIVLGEAAGRLWDRMSDVLPGFEHED